MGTLQPAQGEHLVVLPQPRRLVCERLPGQLSNELREIVELLEMEGGRSPFARARVLKDLAWLLWCGKREECFQSCKSGNLNQTLSKMITLKRWARGIGNRLWQCAKEDARARRFNEQMEWHSPPAKVDRDFVLWYVVVSILAIFQLWAYIAKIPW
jgi:hypothetical protein